jgi:hypothetical protein
MPYLNLDDNFAEHPKHDQLSDGAFRLLTAALCYCAKHTTNGFVEASKLPRLVPRFKQSQLIELLESHPERPDIVAVSGGYHVRDYLQWNKSAEWWADHRAKETKRKAEWRRRRDDGQED